MKIKRVLLCFFLQFCYQFPSSFVNPVLWFETISTLYFLGPQEKCLSALHHGALAPYLFSLLLTNPSLCAHVAHPVARSSAWIPAASVVLRSDFTQHLSSNP